MSNAWSHLPNAQHIDWVLASLKENPELWNSARVSAWDTARAAAWDTALEPARDAAWDATIFAARHSSWYAVRGAVRGAAWGAAWDAVSDSTRDAVYDAILSLIAYDDCDQLLSMSYERLKVWAVLSEDPRAILLLPMIYVKEKLNEQCMVTPA